LSALVDDDYYTIASRLRRLAGQCDGTLRDVDGNLCSDRLSRFVAGVSPSRDRHHRTEDVLHRDDNPLNCQQANLVVVTRGVASSKVVRLGPGKHQHVQGRDLAAGDGSK
jgi:hypothetical protein